MYLQRFGLREEPFGVTPDPRFLYLGTSHREALASLLHGIQTGRGFMSLIAEPGMGKTTLLSDVLQQTHSYVRSISLFQTQCTRLELLRYMLADSGLTPMGDDVVAMHDQFNQMLINNDRAGRKFVVVIDEAQNLSNEVLESVRLLSDFETPQRKLLQIILAGQPQLGFTLSRPEQSQLRQRMSIICRLKPLSGSEVEGYIQTRLAIAGRTAPLFSTDAVNAIALRSGGIPRVINNYCFNLLSLASAMGRTTVGEDLVDEVTLDLELDQDVEAAAPKTLAHPAVSPQALADSFRVLREYRGAPERKSEIGYRPPNTSVAPPQAGINASELRTEKVVKNSTAPARPPETSQPKSPVSADAASPQPTIVATPIRNEPTSRRADLVQKSSPNAPFYSKQKGTAGSKQKFAIRSWALAALAISIGMSAASFGMFRLRQSRVDPVPQAVTTESQPTLVPSLPQQTSGSGEHAATGDKPVATPHIALGRLEYAPEKSLEKQFVSNGSMQAKMVDEMTPPRVAVNSDNSQGFVAIGTASLPKLAVQSSAAMVVPGTLIRKVIPKYPAAVPKWMGGNVELTASVNEDGKVEDVRVDKGTGPLSQVAVAAVREWRYTPFTLNGKPVRATTHVVVKFKPQ